MKCCICNDKPATVHLTQILGDELLKLDFCEDCAKAKGVNDPTSFAMAGWLLDLKLKNMGALKQPKQKDRL